MSDAAYQTEGGLNRVARADATATEARDLLVASFEQATPEMLEDVYLALRSWTWKALNQRYGAVELREWHDILFGSGVLMSRHGRADLGERMAALCELLAESIAAGDDVQADRLVARKHVARTLEILDASGGCASRHAIGEHLGMEAAKVARLVNMMTAAGLIERDVSKRPEVFCVAGHRMPGLIAEAKRQAARHDRA
jgi:hypothetical protein